MRQNKIIATSRKYNQVNGIKKFGSINPLIIGKHGGKNNINKLLASLPPTLPKPMKPILIINPSSK